MRIKWTLSGKPQLRARHRGTATYQLCALEQALHFPELPAPPEKGSLRAPVIEGVTQAQGTQHSSRDQAGAGTRRWQHGGLLRQALPKLWCTGLLPCSPAEGYFPSSSCCASEATQLGSGRAVSKDLASRIAMATPQSFLREETRPLFRPLWVPGA